jgi:hypothetical protein
MKRTWTIIGVGDVSSSLKWYQARFGQPATLGAANAAKNTLDCSAFTAGTLRQCRCCNDNQLGEELGEGQSPDGYRATQIYVPDNSAIKSCTTLLCALRLSALTACA